MTWLNHFSVQPIAGFGRKIEALAQDIGCTATTRRRYAGYSIEARLQR